MEILKIEDEYFKKGKNTCIYTLKNDTWHLLHEIKHSSNQKVYDYCIKHINHADYVYMGLCYEYRNLFYFLYDEIKIVIEKEAVIGLFEKNLGLKGRAYEEAAIASCSFVYDRFDYNEEIEYFIYNFYQSKNKREAVELYTRWQISIPLNNIKFYRVLRTMEFYFDEIINYFENK